MENHLWVICVSADRGGINWEDYVIVIKESNELSIYIELL